MKKYSSIWNYFRRGKTGKEANRLEQEALSDPFLYEALEGLSSVEADHEQIVARLQQRIAGKAKNKSNGRIIRRWLIAASFALLGGVALWLWVAPEENIELAMVTEMRDTMVAGIQADVSSREISLEEAEKQKQSEATEPKERRRTTQAAPLLSRAADKGVTDMQAAPEQQKEVKKQSLRAFRINSAPIPEKEHLIVQDTEKFVLIVKTDSSALTKAMAEKKRYARQTRRNKETTPYRRGRRLRDIVTEAQNMQNSWQKDFDRYVRDSLRYPEDARLQHIEGEVVLSIHLNKQGRPSRIKLVRKLSPSCNREAIRLVEEYPGKLDHGIRDFMVTIRFQLKEDDPL